MEDKDYEGEDPTSMADEETQVEIASVEEEGN